MWSQLPALLSGHVLFSAAGMLLSGYALYVETRKHRNPKYVALCDLSEHMNCSRVLTSEYSKGFGLVEYLVGKEHFLNMPNCIMGMAFYGLQIALSGMRVWWARQLLWYSSVVGVVGSLYLAYVLFFILHDVCLVCIATYVVNFGLLYINYHS